MTAWRICTLLAVLAPGPRAFAHGGALVLSNARAEQLQVRCARALGMLADANRCPVLQRLRSDLNYLALGAVLAEAVTIL